MAFVLSETVVAVYAVRRVIAIELSD